MFLWNWIFSPTKLQDSSLDGSKGRTRSVFLIGNDSGLTNGKNKRMANFKANGQIEDFSKVANGHGHSLNRQNCNRRMADPNSILNLP